MNVHQNLTQEIRVSSLCEFLDVSTSVLVLSTQQCGNCRGRGLTFDPAKDVFNPFVGLIIYLGGQIITLTDRYCVLCTVFFHLQHHLLTVLVNRMYT